MMLRVVGQIASRLVVRGERCRRRKRLRRVSAQPELIEEAAEEGALLSGLTQRHDLGLARRERDADLLFTRPRDGRL
eukprot:1874977-Prymnesium_polylepis.1